MFRKLFIFQLLLMTCFLPALADEGMWIPLLLGKYNIADMQQKGCKLSAEDIYSINQACLKDAVVIFGGGCTGALISDEGLVITNHHCGYGKIQAHSSTEHDYLTDGFWALSHEQELTNPGLTVTFLVRIENVTDLVLHNIPEDDSEGIRNMRVAEAIDSIKNIAVTGTHYKADIKPFFGGSEYYLFVTEVFRDVRLVGTPPSGIGKFGGDTDNWMWPRHTGDFSLFRIYANKNNEPADYSPDNVPYKPKKYLEISTKGVKQGDFTMVMGFPGNTNEYAPSYMLEMLVKSENPNKILIRQAKMDVISTAMNSSAELRIKYSAKYASISNYWKKWIGENRGIACLDGIARKQKFEAAFQQWADTANHAAYVNLLNTYDSIYKKYTPLNLASNYAYEACYTLDIIQLAARFKKLATIEKNDSIEKIASAFADIRKGLTGFFKDYDEATDQKIFSRVIALYYQNIDKTYLPDYLNIIGTKYAGNVNAFAVDFYSHCLLSKPEKINTILDKPTFKNVQKIINDPAYQLYQSVFDLLVNGIYPWTDMLEARINQLDRTYIKAQRMMQPNRIFYPDANFTMRVAYGKVDSYKPSDGVTYNWYTTLDGIMQKENPEIYDYRVPEKLKQLYAQHDFGPWAQNDTMHICFTASNHTTGGNSGSPVLDANGRLIGINFDRNWEGTMSDLMYDASVCRNIVLDIRYVLFIVDKFAGAKNILNELSVK
jgi:hypothetical protein